MPSVPTAPVAAGSFVLGYGAVEVTGSRFVGGIVLVLGGLWCTRAWLRRRDARTAGVLLAVAFVVFVASHLLGLVLGPWPAVLLTAAVMGAAAWLRADARGMGARRTDRRGDLRGTWAPPASTTSGLRSDAAPPT
jgi:hypothetical protein